MTSLDLLCPAPFHDASPAQRARILSRLADSELFSALTEEPADDRAELQIFQLPEGPVALACDAEDRLSGFVGGPVAYVALPGRVLAAALSAEGHGLLVNPGYPSQMLLGADLLAWLVSALGAEPRLAPDEAPQTMLPPQPEVVAALAEPLATRLGDMIGLLESVSLIQADWVGGRRNHVLVLKGAAEERRPALAKALAEFLAFLPEIDGGVDIAFSEAAHPLVALVIEPPPPAKPEPAAKRDPNAPPRLR